MSTPADRSLVSDAFEDDGMSVRLKIFRLGRGNYERDDQSGRRGEGTGEGEMFPNDGFSTVFGVTSRISKVMDNDDGWNRAEAKRNTVPATLEIPSPRVA